MSLNLNCVSPNCTGDSVIAGTSSFDSLDRRQYTPIDKQENLFKKQGPHTTINNASQESSSTSPFHPMKLHPISPDESTSSSKTPVMQKGSFKGASPKKKNSKRKNSKDRYSFSPPEGLEYYQDKSTTTPFTDQSTPTGDDECVRISPVLSTGGFSSTTSRSRAPTPTVNNTSSIRGLSFATGTISPDSNNSTMNQSSSLMNTMDQSSLMNTMNLFSGSDDSSSDEEEPQSKKALKPSRPNQAQRRSSHAKLKKLPYEKADTIKAKGNNEDTPHYYHPAYWNQRLARREVFSRRYRPNPQERDELKQVEEFLGIPEARKSRRTILVQQWRLLNPSTSQASDQNIPMSIVLKRGQVSWGSHEECELILLTRGLVVARKVFQYIPRFQLGEVWTNVDRVLSTGLTSFTIECKDKSLDFSCPTAADQQAWMAALRIVVLQAFTPQASLLDTDDEEAGSRFTPGWQYKVVQTPWFTEAVTGQVQLESGMLDQMDNATLNKLDSYNQKAPLHYAVLAKNVDAIRFLLQAGADPNLEDGMGRTAVQYAEEERLSRSSIELMQSYGGKASIANTTCFKPTPKEKEFSRKCRLGTMAIILLLLVATGVTVFVIRVLQKEDPSAANGISSQEDSVTQDNNDLEPSADVEESDSDSPPPFLVVGVNPIPATNLTTDSPYPSTIGGATLAPTSAPANGDAANPTDGLIDADYVGTETAVDSLAELVYNQTNAPSTGSSQPTLSPSSSPSDTTMTPSTAAPTATPSMSSSTTAPAATPSMSPSTAPPTATPSMSTSLRTTDWPTYPTWEEGTDFLPLTTETPTFQTTIAPTAMPTEKFFVPEFLPLVSDTNAPTFVVAIPATTAAPTATPTATDTPSRSLTENPTAWPTQSPSTLSPTWGPTASPTTFPPTYYPTESPTTNSPTYTPTFTPSESASVVEESVAYVLTTAPIPTNFPTFVNIHGADLLPEDIFLFDFLVANSLDKGAALHSPKSPQYKAFRWLSGNMLLTSYSDERKIQRYVLATLYYSTGGDAWSNNQYWLSDEDECTMWFSRISEVVSNAVCNSQDQIITLDLDYNNLNGRLPKEMGLLTKLRRMELYGGPQWFLTGTIPTEIAFLQELESLSVRGNRLTGAIPSELGNCVALSNLNLSQNRLSGTIPTNLGVLQRLQGIALETNRLKGSVPSQLGRVDTLRSITLGTNSLSGSIFTEIGLLTGLRGFDLEMNQLSSTIPSEMGMLGNLTLFHMSSSGLYGTLPWEIGSMMSLESLQLRGNRLDESIPSSIGQLTSLGALDLSFNHLSGPIPGELGRATLLRSLFLNANKLSGNIPADVASLSRLNTLRLEANDLTGEVPVDVCDVFFNTYPIFYADCFEVACPCCSYCCVDGAGCECVHAGTMDEFLC